MTVFSAQTLIANFYQKDDYAIYFFSVQFYQGVFYERSYKSTERTTQYPQIFRKKRGKSKNRRNH